MDDILMSPAMFEWDVFISHASEDKDSFVRALVRELSKDFRVWYDEFTLMVGDSLRRSIDKGLARSRYGIVVFSPHFFAKEWPQKELDGLVTRERNGEKVILPIWLDVDVDYVARYSPMLADRYALNAKEGLERVVSRLTEVMKHQSSTTNEAISSPTVPSIHSSAPHFREVWSVTLPFEWYDRLQPLLLDEAVILAGRNGELLAIQPRTGNQLWSRAFLSHPEALAADSTAIYLWDHRFGNREATMFALNPVTGETVWRHTQARLGNTEIIAPDGIRIFGHLDIQDGFLGFGALDAHTGQLLWHQRAGFLMPGEREAQFDRVMPSSKGQLSVLMNNAAAHGSDYSVGEIDQGTGIITKLVDVALPSKRSLWGTIGMATVSDYCCLAYTTGLRERYTVVCYRTEPYGSRGIRLTPRRVSKPLWKLHERHVSQLFTAGNLLGLLDVYELKGIDPSNGRQRWIYVTEEPWINIGPTHFDPQIRSLILLQRNRYNGDSRLARIRVPVSSGSVSVTASDLLPDPYAESLSIRAPLLTYVSHRSEEKATVRAFYYSFTK